MSVPILLTKLFIPLARPKLVSRPRLKEQLDHNLHRKLTLISAPAGFGKTTLVTDWLQSQGDDASSPFLLGWLSLDESDNGPTRFLTYLLTALNSIQGLETEIGVGALQMAQSPQPPPLETILISVINEITMVTDKIVLVLDDYHLIDAQQVHECLNFLIENLPPQLHLVITTREDPPIQISRLRARGQLNELRAIDLRFTGEETAVFLNQTMRLNLSGNDIDALEARTEGWIAGLQLAAVSMQGRNDTSSFIQAFTGSNRLVLDYLIEEVLDQQSEKMQEFLSKTAVLDRLTGPLCDAVTDQENGQETLENLEHTNLFIVPLDEERRWYRYHHLFADLLRQQLRQKQPDWILTLHHRASEWFEQKGFINEAIDHALNGEYYERAACLIEDQFGDELIDKYECGEQAVLRRWLAELPAELIFSKPHLSILHAWNLFTAGQLEAANQSLQTTEKLLNANADQAPVSSPEENQLPDGNRMKLVGMVATIRSFLAAYNGNLPKTVQYARQALEVLPEQEQQWRSVALIALGDAYANQGQMAAAHKVRSDALMTGEASGDTHLLVLLNSTLAEILRQQGELQQVIDICERQFRRADESGISETAVVGWLLGIWGEVLAELNNLDRAIEQAKKGVKLAARGGDMLHEVTSSLCLVRVLFSSGDITGAEDVIQSLEKTAHEYDIPLWASFQLSAWQARIWLAQGKLEVASRWVGEHELDPDGEPTYLHEMEYIVLARILIAQERLEEAVRLLQRLLEAAEADGRISSVIEIMMLQALAAQSRGDTTQAMSTLAQALTLAEAGGFIRIFVDEGLPVARLLYEALSRGIRSDYVRRLLAAFPNPEPEQAGASQSQDPEFEWVEPLSERELEILQLIAEGLKNREISARLYLALNTVKTHNRNIFSKLGVNSRIQAVARARALGLLKST